MSLDLQTRADGVVLKVRAVAGASRDRVVGLHGGALKLATTAAPEKGKANLRLLNLLAGSLGLSPGELELVSGQTGREKRFLIRGLTADDLRVRLAPYLHS
jgi:uncharacterized protein (TIGR00251 family)